VIDILEKLTEELDELVYEVVQKFCNEKKITLVNMESNYEDGTINIEIKST